MTKLGPFVRSLVVMGIALAWAAGSAAASGISTHFEAADRSVEMVDWVGHPDVVRIPRGYPLTYRVGAIYPDWGYAYPETHAAAEAAHWPPFHAAALCYLHESYGEPWGPHQEQLFAFLSGMTCHGQMDDVWHFGSTAFLRQAIAIDAPNTADQEGTIEFGTDVFVQVDRRFGTEPAGWWIPVGDLVAISVAAGYPEVTAQRILQGTGAQLVLSTVEDQYAWLLYAPAYHALPWTRANYWTWWDGGVLDGASHTARTLESYWDDYQLLAGGGACSGPLRGPVVMHGHATTLLELADGMVRDGIVRVPYVRAGDGAVLLLAPVVRDRAEVVRRLLAFGSGAPPAAHAY